MENQHNRFRPHRNLTLRFGECPHRATATIASVFLPVASRFGYAPLFFAFALAAAMYFALVSIIPMFRFLFGHKEQE
jgi:hypothetical protein